MDNNCWLKDSCKGLHCNDANGCLIKYKLGYLYDQANVSGTMRKNVPLSPDADGTDLDKFMELKEIQNNIVDFVQNGNQLMIYSRISGNGKAQPDDSLILTSTGYVKMKDIHVGDMIFGDDGYLHHVIGKYDRGIKDIYKIIFNDRTSCLCCDEHLWNISDRNNKKNKEFKTIELKELLGANLHHYKNQGWRYQIPITSALNFPHKTFKLHPYILGYILGDGSTTANSSVCLTINTKDAEDIIPYLNSLLPDSYYVKSSNNPRTPYTYSITDNNLFFGRKEKEQKRKNIIKAELKKYKIINNKTAEKYIPDDYLYADIDSRISLLQGLMDTDGTVIPGTNNISFGNTSKKLIEQFEFLVQSLGGTVTTSVKKNRNYQYKKPDGSIELRPARDFYYCQVKLPSKIIPFKLPRKINAYKNNQQREPYRAIHKIEFYKKEHCYCIMTDNPSHLYLTDSCIVTHNTSWSLKLLQSYFNKIWLKSPLKCRALFISVPAFLIGLKENISNKSEYIAHIKENVLNCDLVIWDDISNKTGTDFEINNLLSIIDTRINNGKANIYTSNISPEELKNYLDIRLGSRIANASKCIEFKGGDKRGLKLS